MEHSDSDKGWEAFESTQHRLCDDAPHPVPLDVLRSTDKAGDSLLSSLNVKDEDCSGA